MQKVFLVIRIKNKLMTIFLETKRYTENWYYLVDQKKWQYELVFRFMYLFK